MYIDIYIICTKITFDPGKRSSISAALEHPIYQITTKPHMMNIYTYINIYIIS